MKRGFLKKEALQDRIEEAIPTVPAEPAHGTEKKALYKHPENAVIFILLDISNCNFLIILVLSIFIEMPFFGWGLIVGLIFDFGNRW